MCISWVADRMGRMGGAPQLNHHHSKKQRDGRGVNSPPRLFVFAARRANVQKALLFFGDIVFQPLRASVNAGASERRQRTQIAYTSRARTGIRMMMFRKRMPLACWPVTGRTGTALGKIDRNSIPQP